MKLTIEQSNDMLWRSRPMVAKVDGIWRGCVGHYVRPLAPPWIACVIVNGKEFFVSEFLDYDTYGADTIEKEVISKNIQSLPPAPEKKRAPVLRAYNYVNNNWAEPEGGPWRFRMRDDGSGMEAYQVNALPAIEVSQQVVYEPPINL